MKEENMTSVYRALYERQMVMGIPRSITIIIWFTACALAFLQFAFFLLPFALFLHITISYFYKKDDYFFDIMLRNKAYQGYFDV